ncbi:hypothetical protein F4808DRAFT_437392 [Astrocystis sublimbata]|nr:hypothetical protein F4808DRAFT_437392 [Astrocystis sublimbata]
MDRPIDSSCNRLKRRPLAAPEDEMPDDIFVGFTKPKGPSTFLKAGCITGKFAFTIPSRGTTADKTPCLQTVKVTSESTSKKYLKRTAVITTMVKPRLKTTSKPIFFIVGICSLHKIGRGRIKVTMSRIKSVVATARYSLTSSPQWPGRSGVHFFSGGVQWNAVAKSSDPKRRADTHGSLDQRGKSRLAKYDHVEVKDGHLHQDYNSNEE